MLRNCFGSDVILLVPKMEDIDIAVVIEHHHETRKPSIWRRMCSLNDDGDGDAAQEEFNEKSHLAIQMVNCFEVFEGEATSTRNVMSQLATRRWEKFSENLKKRQDKSLTMLRARCSHQSQANTRDIGVQVDSTFCSVSLSPQTGLIKSPCFTETNTKIRIGSPVIAHFLLNLQRKVPKYDDMMYDVSLLLHLSSAKTYRVLRQIFCLPAVSSLHRKYHETSSAIKRRLLELDNLPVVLSQIHEEINSSVTNGPPFNPRFTLAIDAFCFRSFSGTPLGPSSSTTPRRSRGNRSHEDVICVDPEEFHFNHGFIFLLISHDYRIPVKLLHLAASQSGAYTKEIDNIAEQIQQVSNRLGLRIWFRATDGDPGMNTTHENFYNGFLDGKSACLSSLVTHLHNKLILVPDMWIPITDPLHAMKNMRSRLIKHSIQIFKWNQHTAIDEIRTLLDLGPVLSDESQIGKMRDSYAVSLFTFKNVSKLLKAGQFVAACFFLPFACWSAVIYSCDIKLSLRLFLVELSFQLLRTYFGQFEKLKAKGVVLKASGESCVTFATPQAAMRMLNTLAAFSLALSFSNENIRMDSLGTHLVENTIGIARATSADPRYERIVETYTNAELKKRVAAKLGVTIHIPGRINQGGCKVDPDHQCGGRKLTKKPKLWRVDDLVNLLTSLCNPKTSSAMADDLKIFLQELDSIASAVDRHEYSVNSAANNGIMARLVHFHRSNQTPNRE